jgi:hypothetical protein
MINSRTENQAGTLPDSVHPSPPQSPVRSKWQRASMALQLILALAVVAGVFAYLQWSGSKNPTEEEEKRPTPPEQIIQLDGPQLIRVRPATSLDSKLQVATVEAAWLTAPVLPVTGMTLASLRPGKETAQDAWQFASPDLLTAFSDWQKAVVDVQFQKTQLQSVRELSEYRVEAQKEVVARMEKLLEAGTERVKDVIAERVNLKQFEIQGKKETHEAENAVKVAEKTEATLARQLQQAGLEPTMLRSAAAEGEIVVAEVPERAVARVKLGMTCQVRFFALPDQVFTGKVSSISPVVSKEKRVLNVQFIVKDPTNVLRPGMFAEIGLGTDKRQALLMPADGLLHVGDKDYALLATEKGAWKITAVETGELRGTTVEVLSGLKAGDRVLGKGAILLKPMVVRALQSPAASSSVTSNGRGQRGDKSE